MKKIIETTDKEGLEKLLGERVLLLCGCYFYNGVLAGVNDDYVMLTDASIVYETGEWSAKQYKDGQKLPAKEWYVQVAAIESFGVGL